MVAKTAALRRRIRIFWEKNSVSGRSAAAMRSPSQKGSVAGRIKCSPANAHPNAHSPNTVHRINRIILACCTKTTSENFTGLVWADKADLSSCKLVRKKVDKADKS